MRARGLAPLLLFALPVSARASDPPRPNLVVIFTDDQGWGDVGYQGAEGFETPNIDRLAAEGVRFTDFYVAQPVCSASRTALLTGCYPNRVGIHGALGPGSKIGIRAAETTLAELCLAEGYATAAFGKWHLGHHPEFLPTRHGFERFYGIPYSNDMWPHHPENPQAWGDLPTLEGETVVGLNTDQTRFTWDFTRRGVEFIEECAREQRPFFLYVAHPMPHVPLHASEGFVGGSEQGLYGDVIEEIDASVGAIVEAVDAAGLGGSTLIVYTSDNGPWLSYGDHAGTTGGLREGKGTTFEGGVRVPFAARWPGHIPAGTICSEPAMTIDILPTVAGLLGAPLPTLPIDGLDIWPLLSGAQGARSPHEALLFWYRQGELEAIRSGRWKLHFPHGYRSMHGRSTGTGGIPGKYDYGKKTGLELYDLVGDRGELRDMAAERPDEVERLVALADAARHALGDRLTGIEGVAVRPAGRHVPAPAATPALPSTVLGLLAALDGAASAKDEQVRAARFEALWTGLVEAGQLPFRSGEWAAFLWRGEARSVSFPGDWNGWDGARSPAVRLLPFDLWLLPARFAADARLDYMVQVDEQSWQLDAANPHVQRSGGGDRSELRMPAWEASEWTTRREETPPPERDEARALQSAVLGRDLHYRLYLPHGAEGVDSLRTLFVLDGREYADPQLGALTTVLDEMVAAGVLEPMALVLVDPRAADVDEMRELYVLSGALGRCLREELVPAVEAELGARVSQSERGLLGVSLSAVAVLRIALEGGGAFGFLAAQSPVQDPLGAALAEALLRIPVGDTRLLLTFGTVDDGAPEARALASTLSGKGWEVETHERHEGHSWGQWRGLADEVLRAFSSAKGP